MGKLEKPSYEELQAYVVKLENKVYRALRTELINRTLFDIADSLNTSSTLQELYASIHEILAKLMDMTNFYIAIYFKKKNAIRFVYHVDNHDEKVVKWIENFTRDRSLTGDVIMAKRPLLLKEKELKRLGEQGRLKGTVPKIWLGIPLMINQEVMGVMAVQSYTNPGQYSESDVDVLTFVSDQIALSIEKKKAQKQLEKAREKLIRSEKLEAIGTLAGGIAHDFNNTLSITLGNINLAQMMVTEPELTQILDDAEISVMQAKELASRFIVFSKGGVILKEQAKSKQFITQALAEIAQEQLISYQLEIGQIPESIEVNTFQLKEALKNVIQNAHESMDETGKVCVLFQLHPGKTDFVVISLVDQGMGIEKENIEKVFEPYYSTKAFGKDKGTGLGMSIAYSIVKSHQGEILIGSNPGKGTRVDIILPICQDQELPENQSGKPPGKPPGKTSDTKVRQTSDKTQVPPFEGNDSDSKQRPKVLIMDDDNMIREISKKILNRIGYEAILAKNGEQAIQTYKKHLTTKDPIGFVILDLEVKQGMGGAATIKELQKLNPDVKAIIASGYSSDRIMEDCQDYGFALAIAKPYSMKALQSALEELSQTVIS
ncbi:MAG: response regulator [Desulfobacula sp.]|nr:response regulator [Desulfobacula sp.]